MRAFIALRCPANLREGILAARDGIGPFGSYKYVEAENLHVTLRFLGDVEEKKVPVLKEKLSFLREKKPFTVSLRGLGAFPSPGSARVVWVGAEKGCEELSEMHREIDYALKPLGYEPDERFSCHLTIARAREVVDRNGLADYIKKNKERDYGSFTASSIELMESRLSPKGPRYYVAESYPLTG